jgi:hypothetical protein
MVSLESEESLDMSSSRSYSTRLARSQFTKEDIDDILYSVANREYLVWNKSNKRTPIKPEYNILRISEESKKTFA